MPAHQKIWHQQTCWFEIINFHLTDSKTIISISTSPLIGTNWKPPLDGVQFSLYLEAAVVPPPVSHLRDDFKVLMNNKSTHGRKGVFDWQDFWELQVCVPEVFIWGWAFICHQLCPGRSTKLPAVSENVKEFSILWIFYILAVSTEPQSIKFCVCIQILTHLCGNLCLWVSYSYRVVQNPWFLFSCLSRLFPVKPERTTVVLSTA